MVRQIKFAVGMVAPLALLFVVAILIRGGVALEMVR
jgi:hypothetical protein